MNATLWIALIGQVITLLVVFIQQIFNSKNLKMQLNNGNKKDSYIEKRMIYKKLLKKTNIENLEKSNYDSTFFDSIYDDVFLYCSREIISFVNRIKIQCNMINDSKKPLKARENLKNFLKYSLLRLRERIKEEYEKI